LRIASSVLVGDVPTSSISLYVCMAIGGSFRGSSCGDRSRGSPPQRAAAVQFISTADSPHPARRVPAR
jgi:hypothetical protein